MFCQAGCDQWLTTIMQHLSPLSKPQALVLALWSFSMVLARSCALTAVSHFLAKGMQRQEQTVRQCGQADRDQVCPGCPRQEPFGVTHQQHEQTGGRHLVQQERQLLQRRGIGPVEIFNTHTHRLPLRQRGPLNALCHKHPPSCAVLCGATVATMALLRGMYSPGHTSNIRRNSDFARRAAKSCRQDGTYQKW